MNLKKYILNKLIFPKVVILDKPGIIFNQRSRKWGNKEIHRTSFFFEDLIAHIQLETIKKCGIKRTREIWYNIGKEVGIRYMLIGGVKKAPKFLLPDIVDYIISGFRSAGMSIANNLYYDSNEDYLEIYGEDNIISRKTKICDFDAGIISGIMTILTGKNLEAIGLNSNGKEQIILSPFIKEKYKPDITNLLQDNSISNTLSINLDTKYNLPSFSKFLKFNKIRIDEFGKYHFFDSVIIPAPSEFREIIGNYYSRINCESILKSGICNGVDSLVKKFNLEKKDYKERIRLLNTLYCVLGWGILNIKINNKKMSIIISNYPVSAFGNTYHNYFLEEFIKKISNKKIELIKSETKNNYLFLDYKTY